MAQETNIAYCHHSWSPWWGCFKIRAGCQNCCARAFAKRCGQDCWGLDPRRMLSDAHWKEPLKWNRAAEKAGERRRVLVSMCDPFEDLCELQTEQLRFCDLIDDTPHLNWLLWTKRPERIDFLWDDWLPRNVWLGVSCSIQKDFDEMVPILLQIPASVLAVSFEPLVEEVYTTKIKLRDRVLLPLSGEIGTLDRGDTYKHNSGIGWGIVGGESGPKRREFKVKWAQRLHDDFKAAGVPFYMKQDSHFRPGQQGRIPDELWAVKEVPHA